MGLKSFSFFPEPAALGRAVRRRISSLYVTGESAESTGAGSLVTDIPCAPKKAKQTTEGRG